MIKKTSFRDLLDLMEQKNMTENGLMTLQQVVTETGASIVTVLEIVKMDAVDCYDSSGMTVFLRSDLNRIMRAMKLYSKYRDVVHGRTDDVPHEPPSPEVSTKQPSLTQEEKEMVNILSKKKPHRERVSITTSPDKVYVIPSFVESAPSRIIGNRVEFRIEYKQVKSADRGVVYPLTSYGRDMLVYREILDKDMLKSTKLYMFFNLFGQGDSLLEFAKFPVSDMETYIKNFVVGKQLRVCCKSFKSPDAHKRNHRIFLVRQIALLPFDQNAQRVEHIHDSDFPAMVSKTKGFVSELALFRKIFDDSYQG